MKKGRKRLWISWMVAVTAVINLSFGGFEVRAGELSVITAFEGEETVGRMPDKIAETGRILIYESRNYADEELGALLGGTVETEPFRPLLEDTYSRDGEAPDLILILTDYRDTLLSEAQDSDGDGETDVPEKRMGSMDTRSVINHLRQAVGTEMPVLWAVLSEEKEAVSSANLFSCVSEMDGSSYYSKIYGNYTYYRSEDPSDRASLAERIVLPLSGSGLFTPLNAEAEAQPVYNDITFYISEAGNDKASGRTPDQPLKTGSGFAKRLREIYGTNLDGIPVGTRIVIEVTGEIVQSTSQAMFVVLGTDALTAPRDTNGDKIPALIETYQYNGTNRATVLGTYAPHDGGSSRITVGCPVTFKNIKIATAATPAKLAMKNFYCLNTSVVFDNTVFEARNGEGFTISPSNNTWLDSYDVGEGNFVENTVTLKNGVYDETTGVSYIAAVNMSGLYRTEEKGGTIREGRMLKERIVVSEGAVCGNVYALASSLPVASTEIVVEKGGVVRNLAVTKDNISAAAYEADVFIQVKNAEVRGELHGIGTLTTLTGDVRYEIENSRIIGMPVDEEDFSDMFGREGAVIKGRFDFSMKNSLFVMKCGLNAPSSIAFGGYRMTAEEGSALSMNLQNTGFVFLPNSILTNADTFMHFGPNGGKIAGDFDISLRSVLVDTSLIQTSEVYFGTENASVSKMTVTLGDAELSGEGTVFYGGDVYLGGKNIWLGGERETGGSVREDVVLSTALYRPVFHSDVYMTAADTEKDGSGYTNGSVLETVEGGFFEKDLVLATGKVYGNLTAAVRGIQAYGLVTGEVIPEEISPESSSEGEEPVSVKIVEGKLSTELIDNDVDYLDGVSMKPDEKAGKTFLESLPWLYAAVGGSVALLAVLILVFVRLAKKKKKS